MKSVHLVIPDLWLPPELATAVCRDLDTPVLGRMLGRAVPAPERNPATSLEQQIAELFGLPPEAGFARLFARQSGLEDGHWLRADPVYLDVQRDRLVLQEVPLDADTAAILCADLNRHFSADGLVFLAPHPQRWYVRCDAPPRMQTTPLFEAVGNDVQSLLPAGDDALAWVRRFNEIQMLFYGHAQNEVREAAGQMPVNSVWFWGEGVLPEKWWPEYAQLMTGHGFPRQLAEAGGVAHSPWQLPWQDAVAGMQLLVWEELREAARQGDWYAWRESVIRLESLVARPLWQALRAGRISRIVLDTGGGDGWRRAILSRRDSWAIWRSTASLVPDRV